MTEMDVYTDASVASLRHGGRGGIGAAIYAATKAHRPLVDLERIEATAARGERPTCLALGDLIYEVVDSAARVSALALELRAAAVGIRRARSLGATSIRLFTDCEAVAEFTAMRFGPNTAPEAARLDEQVTIGGVQIVKIDRRWNGAAHRLARSGAGY